MNQHINPASFLRLPTCLKSSLIEPQSFEALELNTFLIRLYNFE